MITEYFSINNGEYDIKFKAMKPEAGNIGTVILGVHGFCGDKESSALTALASRLTPLGAAVICFDFPSHGESPVNGDKVRVKNCARDLLLAADYCRKNYPDAEKAVFATSFGGYITALCADDLSDFRLILRAPAVTMGEHILLDLLGVTKAQFKASGSIEVGFERRFDLPFEFYEDLLNNPVCSKTLKNQTLVINGDCDDVVPPADIDAFCALNPAARHAVIKGADHRFKKPGELESVIDAAQKFLRLCASE